MTQEGRFGYSPDSGEFQIRDHKAYWEDGDITDMDVGVFRWIPITTPRERYADWTDAQRLEAQKKAYAERQQLQRELNADSQVHIQDSALYCLNDEQRKLIVDALESLVVHECECGSDNWHQIRDRVERLVAYLEAGGEAP
jgi:hypothetical protein